MGGTTGATDATDAGGGSSSTTTGNGSHDHSSYAEDHHHHHHHHHAHHITARSDCELEQPALPDDVVVGRHVLKETGKQGDEAAAVAHGTKDGEGEKLDAETMAKVARVRQAVIGSQTSLSGPFGSKPIVYADYTASGRAVSFIEDFIRTVVLPTYANTHTEASATGLQTTEFREEARDIVRQACGGIRGEHVVLFTGSGSTAAIAEMIGVLEMAVPHDVLEKYGLSQSIPDKKWPVVFIGPYEHHSNEVSWRETLATVITIPARADGRIDIGVLETMLKRYKNRPLKIGSFSAGSNVTGVLTDVPALAMALHRHGALAFFDYAAAAPYVDIDMQLSRYPDKDAYLDAVFISPHKFVGGPGTPGVLVARSELFHNASPVHPGGGTVEFVSPTRHKYKADIETREEGGTPDIVGSIRCGLVFKLKMDIGVHNIHALEMNSLRAALNVWCKNKNILLLGRQQLPKLTITSFVIRVGDKFLHHNFVVALLNDLFGIQSRGGCSCAGPYGHRLLHVTAQESDKFSAEIAKGAEGIKPGWARINFPYFLDEHTCKYIIDAVDMVATHGWKMLPEYEFDIKTGLWRHRSAAHADDVCESLHSFKFNILPSQPSCGGSSHNGERGEDDEAANAPVAAEVASRPTASDAAMCTQEGLSKLLQDARAALETSLTKDRTDAPPQKVVLTQNLQRLCWFALPADYEQLHSAVVAGPRSAAHAHEAEDDVLDAAHMPRGFCGCHDDDLGHGDTSDDGSDDEDDDGHGDDSGTETGPMGAGVNVWT